MALEWGIVSKKQRKTMGQRDCKWGEGDCRCVEMRQVVYRVQTIQPVLAYANYFYTCIYNPNPRLSIPVMRVNSWEVNNLECNTRPIFFFLFLTSSKHLNSCKIQWTQNNKKKRFFSRNKIHPHVFHANWSHQHQRWLYSIRSIFD